ncbi:glycosyltransferase [Rhodococcus antarcticus]|uniref:glycosyltransferase n=1 Tax=Rhodococcus antarcticus TaxID=2987751 RepID=UPI003F493C41
MVRAGALLAVAGAVHARTNRRLLRRPLAAPPRCDEQVTVCVPARDEERTVGLLLGDLRRQVGVPRLRVLVLDDDSTDATAARARAGGAQVTSSHGPPAPGWLGKPAACHRLAELAREGRTPDVLVFVDADVRLAPHAVAASVELLRRHRLALVSPWPTQLAGSVAERLVQPLQQWSWLTTLPLRVAEFSRRPSLAAANGQLLVVDAAAYAGVGGHGAVAAEVVEDVALARALRRAGHRTAPADGSTLARCRMYDGAREVRDGYGKSLWTAFGSPAGSAAVLALLGLTQVLPAVAALAGSGRTRAWGLLGWAAGADSRATAARTAGTPGWPDSVAQPVSVLVLAALTVHSHRGHRRGALTWKGRQLP